MRVGVRPPDPQGGDRCLLRYRRRTDQQRVLDLVDRIRQRYRDHHVADPPACHPVRLGEGVERDGVPRCIRQGPRREVPRLAVDEVLVCLVVHVEDAPLPAQRIDGPQRRLRIDRAGRIVGRHGHDRARPRRHRRSQRLEIELVLRRRRRRDHTRASHHDRHLVVEVVRSGKDDLIAGIRYGEHGVHEGLVAAGGDEHTAPGTDGDPVLPVEFFLDRFHQGRQALNRSVAVIAQCGSEALRRLDRGGWRAVGDDALAQRNAPRRLGDPAADDRNDGRLHSGETPGLDMRRGQHALSIPVHQPWLLGSPLNGPTMQNRGSPG